jgi:hypothetical protein
MGMSEDSAAGAGCRGAAANCELLISLAEGHAKLCEDAGIVGAGAIVQAMAVGLVIEVWRNGPVEAMHSSRRGPSDAAMFAESTALHGVAVEAVTADNRNFGLLDIERHLLDRVRPWAGTGGRNLKDLGYGFLGQYERHVKDRTDALMSLGDHTCVSDALQVYLVRRAMLYGRNHMGMPGWQVIVDRIGVLLTHPDHPAWGDAGRGPEALAGMPQRTPPVDQLTATLLANPASLSVDVLEWLSDHLLYCAAPPYRTRAWETAELDDCK